VVVVSVVDVFFSESPNEEQPATLIPRPALTIAMNSLRFTQNRRPLR
jgi:hypothetical protein